MILLPWKATERITHQNGWFTEAHPSILRKGESWVAPKLNWGNLGETWGQSIFLGV